MLIQPPQNNIINARTLQSPPQRYPIILNPHNNAGNTRIFVGNSPPVKIIRQPQRLSYSPMSNYMMHLIPQQPTIVSPMLTFNPSPNVVRSASLSLVNKFTDQKSQPLTQSMLTVQRPQRVIINNSCSTGYRSRGTSELSNKKSKLINCKNEYMIPQSPSNLKKMQPIRRVSQHKLNISTSDNQGQQQQNIRIIIQTDSANQINNTPSKITIEHRQGANNNQMTATNGAFVINTQPKAQNSPVTNDSTPKVALLSENKLNGSTNLVENNVINSATYSQIAPASFELRTENRGCSYSLDSKHPQKQKQNKAQIKSKFKSRNEASSPQIIVLDPPSDLFVDKKPISFSIQQPNSQFKDSQSSKKHRIYKERKEEKQQQSSSKNEKNKLSIESSKVNRQERKKILKEVYNEYYDESDELIQSSMKETLQRKNYLIYDEHKSLFASALLLNQIYENEVHKALLRMNVVQKRSKEKSIKRRNY